MVPVSMRVGRGEECERSEDISSLNATGTSIRFFFL